MARMIVADHDYVSKRYKLHQLKELEELVADAVQVCTPNDNQAARMILIVCQVNLPFNNPITGFCVRKLSTPQIHRHELIAACRLSLIKLEFMRKLFLRVRPSPKTNFSEALIGI